MLDFIGVKLPDPRPRMWAVNCSLNWAHSDASRICLSSTSQVWLGHRGRMAMGVEHLRMLGIVWPGELDNKLAAFDDKLLKDLAGNAFDTASALVSKAQTNIAIKPGAPNNHRHAMPKTLRQCLSCTTEACFMSIWISLAVVLGHLSMPGGLQGACGDHFTEG